MKQDLLVAAMVLAAATTASEAAAQACIGVPIPDRAFAVEGTFSTTDGGKGYGGSLTANLAGPLSIQGEYTLWDLDDVDENVNAFGGLVAFELPTPSFSLCPLVGAEYMTFSFEESGLAIDATELTIPIGLGLGHELEVGENLALNLFVIPQYLYIRTKGEISFGGMGGEETETSNEFGSVLGARLGVGNIHFGAAASVTTIAQSDPVFTLSVAFAFGGARH